MSEYSQRVVARLADRFPEADFRVGPLLIREGVSAEQYCIRVSPDLLLDVMRFCYEDRELAFDQLCDLTCIDYLDFPEATDRFAVLYSLVSLRHGHRLWAKCFVNDPDPVVPSVTSIWHGANWPEREVWDLFGVRFEGHPDLRRIVTWDGFEAHPLRKDYPLRGCGEREQYPVVRRESTDVQREKIETPAREEIEN